MLHHNINFQNSVNAFTTDDDDDDEDDNDDENDEINLYIAIGIFCSRVVWVGDSDRANIWLALC